jgi:hypothetical protein
MRQEATRQEATRQEATRQEATRQEATRQEATRQEATQPNSCVETCSFPRNPDACLTIGIGMMTAPMMTAPMMPITGRMPPHTIPNTRSIMITEGDRIEFDSCAKNVCMN